MQQAGTHDDNGFGLTAGIKTQTLASAPYMVASDPR